MKKEILPYIAFLLLTCKQLSAQDTQYWTQQFGTRSALMGGIVVGGAKDNTMIFYNPGSLGFIDSASVSVNATAYRIENITIQNAIGQSADFKSSQIGIIPLVVSGMFSRPNKRLKIGYAFVSPVVFDFKATARLDNTVPIVDDAESPGNEEFIGQQSINISLREDVLAFGLGYKLNEHWSVGLSNLFTLRSHNYTKATLARFYLNDADHTLVTSSILQNFSYSHLRYAARFGIAYKNKNFDAGLTITSPGLRIMGKGTVAADITATNIKFNGSRQDLLANDRQPKLKTTYRSPFNVAAGFNFRFRRSLLAVSGQYYGSEAIYDILRAEPSAFVRPASLYTALGSEEFLRVKTGAKSVVNAGLAYEQYMKNGLTLIASVRSNMSYYDKEVANEIGIKPDLTSWDIYHLVIGGTKQKGKNSISLGLMLSYGKDNAKIQQGNFNDIDEDNFLQGITTITKANYSSFGIILGYSFHLK